MKRKNSVCLSKIVLYFGLDEEIFVAMKSLLSMIGFAFSLF